MRGGGDVGGDCSRLGVESWRIEARTAAARCHLPPFSPVSSVWFGFSFIESDGGFLSFFLSFWL